MNIKRLTRCEYIDKEKFVLMYLCQENKDRRTEEQKADAMRV